VKFQLKKVLGTASYLGAVAVRAAASATYAKVAATTAIAEGDDVIGVQAPVLGATSDAKVDTDTTGSLSGKLRGVVSRLVEISAQLPTSLGQTTSANSLSVAIASDNYPSTLPRLVIDWREAPTEVSVSSSSATSSQLSAGWYAISCTCDVYVKQGDSGVSAATTDRLLPAWQTKIMYVGGGSDDYAAGITDSDTGTLQIQPLREV
jgi:hypothetical protein